MLYQTRGSETVGSLMTYWSHGERGVSCRQSIGMGSERSEWG
jgi:hypothetical protein